MVSTKLYQLKWSHLWCTSRLRSSWTSFDHAITKTKRQIWFQMWYLRILPSNHRQPIFYERIMLKIAPDAVCNRMRQLSIKLRFSITLESELPWVHHFHYIEMCWYVWGPILTITPKFPLLFSTLRNFLPKGSSDFELHMTLYLRLHESYVRFFNKYFCYKTLFHPFVLPPPIPTQNRTLLWLAKIH